MMDFHCGFHLHGRLLDNGLLEVACQSRMCGKVAGNVILHRFNPTTGLLVETLRYKKPLQPQREKEDKAV